jgi:hypothetical protein
MSSDIIQRANGLASSGFGDLPINCRANEKKSLAHNVAEVGGEDGEEGNDSQASASCRNGPA